MNFTLNDLNQHFLTVADKVVQGISPTSLSPLSFVTTAESTFQLNTVSEALVISIIYSLDTKQVSGVDDIPVRFINTHLEDLLLGLLTTVLCLEHFLNFGNTR